MRPGSLENARFDAMAVVRAGGSVTSARVRMGVHESAGGGENRKATCSSILSQEDTNTHS